MLIWWWCQGVAVTERSEDHQRLGKITHPHLYPVVEIERKEKQLLMRLKYRSSVVTVVIYNILNLWKLKWAKMNLKEIINTSQRRAELSRAELQSSAAAVSHHYKSQSIMMRLLSSQGGLFYPACISVAVMKTHCAKCLKESRTLQPEGWAVASELVPFRINRIMWRNVTEWQRDFITQK